MNLEQSLEGLSILVVEDEYFCANELKLFLVAGGAKVVRLSGQVSDACKQLKENNFEIALLDINIRGDRVYSVADELKKQKIPFAFISGYDCQDIPTRFAGVPLWAKPINDRQLMKDVCRLRKCRSS